MIAKALFTIQQPYAAPAAFVAAWLQNAERAAPLAWTVRRGSIVAEHSVDPRGVDACVLTIRASTSSRALWLAAPALRIAVRMRAPRLARACAAEWRAGRIR